MGKRIRASYAAEAAKKTTRGPGGRPVTPAPDPWKIKRYSHTGNKPLVESLTNPGCMVTQKVRRAQEARRPWLVKDKD